MSVADLWRTTDSPCGWRTSMSCAIASDRSPRPGEPSGRTLRSPIRTRPTAYRPSCARWPRRASVTRSPARRSTAWRARSPTRAAVRSWSKARRSRRSCSTARPPTARSLIADTLAELRRLAAAGITRVGVRVCLPGVGNGTSHFGVPMAELRWPRAARRRSGCASRPSPSTSGRPIRPPDGRDPAPGERAGGQRSQPPERFAAAAKMLAGLAVRWACPYRRRRRLPARPAGVALRAP